jgi:hypothetical protein
LEVNLEGQQCKPKYANTVYTAITAPPCYLDLYEAGFAENSLR